MAWENPKELLPKRSESLVRFVYPKRVLEVWKIKSQKKSLFAFEEVPIYKQNDGTHGWARRLFRGDPLGEAP